MTRRGLDPARVLGRVGGRLGLRVRLGGVARPAGPVATRAPGRRHRPEMSGQGYWVVDDRGRGRGPGRRHPPRLARPRAPGAGRAGGLDLGHAERARGTGSSPTSGRVHHFGDASVHGDLSKVTLDEDDHRHHRHAVGPRLLHGRRQRRDLHVRRRRLPRLPGQRAAQRAHGVDRAVDDGAGLLAGRRATAASSPSATPLPGLGAGRPAVGTRLNAPVAGMVRYGDGYLLVGRDGGVFNFSSGRVLRLARERPAGVADQALASAS